MYYGGETRKSKAHEKKLTNNNKSMRINGTWQNQIGKGTRLYDKNNREICVGDIVKWNNGRDKGTRQHWRSKTYIGRVFWHYIEECYVIAWEKYYGHDDYKLESYGKCIIIPSDNGGRMHMEVLDEINEGELLAYAL